MTNASKELTTHIEDRKVRCAVIHDDSALYGDAQRTQILLHVGHTEVDFNRFMSQLNFDYDNGYGGQNLFGTVWYMDGSWSERGEYDGSEWWEHKELPEIPQELINGVFDQTHLLELKP